MELQAKRRFSWGAALVGGALAALVALGIGGCMPAGTAVGGDSTGRPGDGTVVGIDWVNLATRPKMGTRRFWTRARRSIP